VRRRTTQNPQNTQKRGLCSAGSAVSAEDVGDGRFQRAMAGATRAGGSCGALGRCDSPGVDTCRKDLASLDDGVIFDGRTLVTASALLDLVSEAWLCTLAARCAEGGAAVLFALSYDGRIDCSPGDPDDGRVVTRVNEHQRIDKGFGPALGPGATDCAARCFASRGYLVRRARSDWTLPPESQELQQQLIDGWAQAATAMAPSEAAIIAGGRSRRLAHVAANRSHLIAGHEDLAAWKSKDVRI